MDPHYVTMNERFYTQVYVSKDVETIDGSTDIGASYTQLRTLESSHLERDTDENDVRFV